MAPASGGVTAASTDGAAAAAVSPDAGDAKSSAPAVAELSQSELDGGISVTGAAATGAVSSAGGLAPVSHHVSFADVALIAEHKMAHNKLEDEDEDFINSIDVDNLEQVLLCRFARVPTRVLLLSTLKTRPRNNRLVTPKRSCGNVVAVCLTIRYLKQLE